MSRPRLTVIALALLAAITAFPTAVSATSTSSAKPAATTARFHAPVPCGRRGHSRPDIRHVIVIVMENHSYSEVIGHAPYMTALAGACGLATNYHDVGNPSLPNYLAMTSGSTHGLHKDCDPTQCPQSGLSIFRQLSLRSKLWQAFDESMPVPCSLAGTRLYAPRHNPAVYYTSLRLGCRTRDVRMGTPASGPFHQALRGRLGSYVFVTPNICNDAHSCHITTADQWLGGMIQQLQSSPALGQNSAIFILFDEASADNSSCCELPSKAGGRIPLIIISPLAKTGFQDDTPLDHYSLLKTILQAWNLPGLGETLNAATQSITAPWK